MSKSTSDDTVKIPTEFTKIICDLVSDILTLKFFEPMTDLF